MKNKVIKENKTKFDYVARKLGICGVVIMALTFIIGGSVLVTTKKQNLTLTQNLDYNSKKIERIQEIRQSNEFVVELVEGKVKSILQK